MRYARLFGVSVGILCTLWSWSQLQPGSPWPSLGKDYRNTRKTTLGAPTNGSVRWMYIEREDRARCSPVIAADGTIYYGTSTALYAVRPNGTRRWIFSNGLSMAYSTPAIGADGTIYTIANPQDAQLVAINPNGTLRWSLYLGGTDVYSSPAIGPDGFIYVTNGAIPGGYLYCIHPNGTVRWRLFLDVEVNSTPCFGEMELSMWVPLTISTRFPERDSAVALSCLLPCAKYDCARGESALLRSMGFDVPCRLHEWAAGLAGASPRSTRGGRRFRRCGDLCALPHGGTPKIYPFWGSAVACGRGSAIHSPSDWCGWDAVCGGS